MRHNLSPLFLPLPPPLLPALLPLSHALVPSVLSVLTSAAERLVAHCLYISSHKCCLQCAHFLYASLPSSVSLSPPPLSHPYFATLPVPSALAGNYVNFGVFKLYGDPALDNALDMALNLSLAIPLTDIIAFRKVQGHDSRPSSKSTNCREAALCLGGTASQMEC